MIALVTLSVPSWTKDLLVRLFTALNAFVPSILGLLCWYIFGSLTIDGGISLTLSVVAWRHEARTVLTPVLEVESSFCCSLIASLCLTAFLADSKVSFGSN